MSIIDNQFEDALHREARARTADLQLPEPEELAPDAPAPRLEQLVDKYGDLPCAQALAVWSARVNGSSIVDVAMRMGISLQMVKNLLYEVHRAIAEDLKQNLDLNRSMDLERIDDLLEAHLPKAKSGKVKSAQFVLRCLERRAKLVGTDALPEPTRTNQTNIMVWLQNSLPSINKLVDSLPTELPPPAPGI